MLSDMWKIKLLIVGIPRYLYLGLGLVISDPGQDDKTQRKSKTIEHRPCPALLRCGYGAWADRNDGADVAAKCVRL